MKFIRTKLPGLTIIEPVVFEDSRGYFLESFNLEAFEKNIHPIKFVQDNESMSSKGVFRGLHFQKPPFAQSKLVRCIQGRIMDIVVDIRIGSPTYGKYLVIELSSENKRQIFIPRGFAHGFLVLSEEAVFSYKVDNFYAPDYDSGVRYDDSDLNINLGSSEEEVHLSVKDGKLPFFKDLKSPFRF